MEKSNEKKTSNTSDRELSRLLGEKWESDGTIETPRVFKLFVQTWWRNPLFYTSTLFGLFCIAVVAIHAPWQFKWALAIAAVSFVFLTFLPLYYVFSNAINKKEFSRKCTLYCWVPLVFVTFLAAQGAVVWYQTLLIRVHFAAPDPKWSSFPTICKENGFGLPIINCVRVGENITNPRLDYGDSPLTMPKLNSSVSRVQKMFEVLLEEDLGCMIIHSSSGFLHGRCLSMFQGYPDDVAFHFSCNSENSTSVWVHSQSRLGVWDFNFNDARIRLIIGYIELSLRWCTGIDIKPGSAPWSCFSKLELGGCSG